MKTSTAIKRNPHHPYKSTKKRLIVEIIRYRPSSELVTAFWSCPLHLLIHLLRHPTERLGLLAIAKRRSPRKPKDFYVYHPLLHSRLKVNSFHLDGLFLHNIQALIQEQVNLCSTYPHQCTPILPPVFSPPTSTPTPLQNRILQEITSNPQAFLTPAPSTPFPKPTVPLFTPKPSYPIILNYPLSPSSPDSI
jgi:hypothetical protein